MPEGKRRTRLWVVAIGVAAILLYLYLPRPGIGPGSPQYETKESVFGDVTRKVWYNDALSTAIMALSGTGVSGGHQYQAGWDGHGGDLPTYKGYTAPYITKGEVLTALSDDLSSEEISRPQYDWFKAMLDQVVP